MTNTAGDRPIMTNLLAESYDRLHYEGKPISWTHPDRLSVVTQLFGLEAPPVDGCRYLEIGCGTGNNLLGLATTLPEATFVGVDLSAGQIAEADAAAREMGVANVSFHAQSILDVGDTFGDFDFIVAHGVFSWVPAVVQTGLLKFCADHLTPNGVAYVSYNVYPGWHLRQVVRDLVRYHFQPAGDPVEQLKRAHAYFEFVSNAAPKNLYGELLRRSHETLWDTAPWYIYHEYLEEENHPIYFRDFVDLATKAGLQYMGDSRITAMSGPAFTPEVCDALRRLASSYVDFEQQCDLLNGQSFRRSMLVKPGRRPDWELDPKRIMDLYVQGHAHGIEGGGAEGAAEDDRFRLSDGNIFTALHPVVKAGVQELERRGPEFVAFDDLAEAVYAAMKTPEADKPVARETLAAGLLEAFIHQAVDLRKQPPPFTTALNSRPRGATFARWQAARGENKVTNLCHRETPVDDLARRVLCHLDGVNDAARVLELLTEDAAAGRLAVQRRGEPVTDPDDVQEALAAALSTYVQNLAACALIHA
ncbi:MAG: methyltransferase regulatory domain-containing protein [Planctomycetia bacterium]